MKLSGKVAVVPGICRRLERAAVVSKAGLDHLTRILAEGTGNKTST